MRKITWAEIEAFEKDLLFKQIANPHYRYGQAFLNYFTWVHKLMEEDGDLGWNCASNVWNSKNRLEVLDLVDWYIEGPNDGVN